MAKVSLNPVERKKWALTRYILGEMAKQKISQAYMAEQLDISQQALNRRLKNNSLEYEHLVVIFKVLKTPDEELLELMR